MKRPNNLVEMGYEAPWSAKIGTKKSLAYVSNEEELDDFWLSYARYVAKQGGKKQKKAEEVVIVFSNMQDIAKVSPLLAMNCFSLTSFRRQTKASGRGKEPPDGKSSKDNAVFDARSSAQDEGERGDAEIQKAMYCDRHDRLCYKTWDGKCGPYTGDNVLDHATMLVSIRLLSLLVVLTCYQGSGRIECCCRQGAIHNDIEASRLRASGKEE